MIEKHKLQLDTDIGEDFWRVCTHENNDYDDFIRGETAIRTIEEWIKEYAKPELPTPLKMLKRCLAILNAQREVNASHSPSYRLVHDCRAVIERAEKEQADGDQ